jgi:H+-transporting ATPase
VRTLMLIGGLLATLVLILSFGVFFVGRDMLGLNLAELQTLVFVMLVATGQGNVYLVRERGPFWRSRPSRWLIVSSVVDLVVVTGMAAMGILMAPVSITLIGLLLVVVAAYLVVLDHLKVRMFRHMASE